MCDAVPRRGCEVTISQVGESDLLCRLCNGVALLYLMVYPHGIYCVVIVYAQIGNGMVEGD